MLRNIQEAFVTTAVLLTDELRSRVSAQVALCMGEVEMRERIADPTSSAAACVDSDQMIDASVKRQIKALGRELTEHDYEPEL